MADKKVNIILNPHETPILYTDSVNITVNEDGVIFDIGQPAGNSGQIHVVSRVGMSREHAKKFVKKLSEILALTTSSPKKN